MKNTLLMTTAIVAVLTLSGCGEDKNAQNSANSSKTAQGAAEATQTESDRLNARFEQVFMRDVMDNPEFQTYQGIKKDYGKWDVRTEEKAAADHARTINDLKELQTNYDYDKLDKATKLSYDLAVRALKEQIEGYKWRYYSYPVNQMFGWQSRIPAFLINFHRVTSLSDAEAYISRLEGVKATADQRMAAMKRNQTRAFCRRNSSFPM